MTKPKIVLTSHFGVTYPNLDYTALTGGSADWNQSATNWQGPRPSDWDGSAYWIGAPGGEGRGKWKAGTGDALKPTVIGTLDSISGSSIGGVEWQTAQYDTPDTRGGFQDTSGQFNFSGNPCGLRHPFDVDERSRVLKWYGQTYGSGWHAEVSFEDGSFPLQTLALPSGDFTLSGFEVSVIAGSACKAYLDIVKRTAGGGGIQCPAILLEAPVRVRRQRFMP